MTYQSLGPWVNVPPGTPPPPGAPALSAANLAHIEAGISAVESAAAAGGVAALTTGRALTLTDVGTVLEVNSATDTFVTVPLDSAVNFPVGAVIEVARLGAGRVWVYPLAYNLIANPSTETGAPEFVERNGHIQQLAAAAIYGTYGIRATSIASGQNIGWFGPGIDCVANNIQAGDAISGRLDFRCDTGLTASLTLRFRAGTTIITTASGNLVDTGTSKIDNAIVPAGTDNILAVTGSTNTTAAAQNIDSDGLMVVRGPVSPAVYADGDSPGWSWTGTAGASASMGPLVRGLGLTLARYGRLRLRKRAANDWVLDNPLPPEAITTTSALHIDRDNGQAGILAPSANRFGLAATALVANQAYLLRFVPSRAMAISKLAFRVTTASGTNDPVDVGIYDAAGTRVVSSGATTSLLNSTGTKTATVATTVLTAGSVYYAALAANSAATVSFASGIGDGFGTAAPAAEVLTKATSYPLPATLSALTAADAGPALWVRES